MAAHWATERITRVADLHSITWKVEGMIHEPSDEERSVRSVGPVGKRTDSDSEMVCCPADEALEDGLRERRGLAVQRLIAMEVEDPPEPATLSRELEAAHEPGGIN